MRDSRPQSLDSLFDETKILQDVQQRAIALLKLNNALKALLPTHLQAHCRIANYRRGVLIIDSKNATWQAGLRYELPSLLSAFRADILPSLASIDLRINPQLAAQEANNPKAIPATDNMPTRQLSQNSAQHIKEIAQMAPEKLRKKLERLAAMAGESAKTTNRSK